MNSREQSDPDLLLAIGSNIAPKKNIKRAMALLRKKVQIRDVSTFYWSQPIGGSEQPRFINGACRVYSPLPLAELKFGVLRDIERKLGRVRTSDKYAPREIDLDIAMYGDKVITETDLVVPDPDIVTRPFLAVPLAEVAPDWIVPGVGECLRDIASRVSDGSLEPAVELTQELKKELLR